MPINERSLGCNSVKCGWTDRKLAGVHQTSKLALFVDVQLFELSSESGFAGEDSCSLGKLPCEHPQKQESVDGEQHNCVMSENRATKEQPF
jgi:hypothetical protein